MPYPDPIHRKLCAIYEDMMWLAGRTHVSPQQARAWYSSVMAESLKTKVRMFTGRVSEAVVTNPNQKLVLEHYERLSFQLSSLLVDHVHSGNRDHTAFLELVERCERVNITTDAENHRARTHEGNYEAANIILVKWADAPLETRRDLWQHCLRGKVANAEQFRPPAK